MFLFFLLSCQKTEPKLETAENVNIIENRITNFCIPGSAGINCTTKVIEDEPIIMGSCTLIVSYVVVTCQSTNGINISIGHFNIDWGNSENCSRLYLELNTSIPTGGSGWTEFINKYNAFYRELSKIIEYQEALLHPSSSLVTVDWIEANCMKYCASPSTGDPEEVPGWVESVCSYDGCCFRTTNYTFDTNGNPVPNGEVIVEATVLCPNPVTGFCDNNPFSSGCQSACSKL